MSQINRCFELPGATHLAFNNGSLSAEHQGELGSILPEGVSLDLDQGIELRLGEGVELDRPIHLAYHNSAAVSPGSPALETRIIVGPGSRGTLIESSSGLCGNAQGAAQHSVLQLGEDAALDHVKLQREELSSIQRASSKVSARARSNYRSHEINIGGGETRRQLDLTLCGEGARCELAGLNLAFGRQRMESRVRVTHAAAGCATDELYKIIVGDDARALFDGLILVETDSQLTRAHQSNRNLLLSDRARITSMPRLEIYADDVRCSHGSTTGELDAEQLFYLRTRGFTPDAARALLVHAFASEILEGVEFTPLREWLTGEVLRRLPGGELIGEAA